MSYNKGSFDSFRASLREGKYESATGARRAIGKLASLSAEEKDKARKLVDHHFGETAAAKPKAAPAKSAKAAPKAPSGRQPKPAAAAAPAAKKPGRQPRTAKPEAVVPSVNGGAVHDDLQVGERIVASSTSAIQALQTAMNTSGIDTRRAIDEYAITLSQAVGIFRRVAHQHGGTADDVPASQASEPAQPAAVEDATGAPYFPEFQGAHA